MGLHKLTAGDGYTYLTRQVAVQDATERGARQSRGLLRRAAGVAGRGRRPVGSPGGVGGPVGSAVPGVRGPGASAADGGGPPVGGVQLPARSAGCRVGADRGAGPDSHVGGRRAVSRRARAGAARRPGAGGVPGPVEPAADHGGGGVRPDVHAGEVGLGALGGGAAGGRRGGGGGARCRGRAVVGLPGAGGAVHPSWSSGCPAGPHAGAGHCPVPASGRSVR